MAEQQKFPKNAAPELLIWRDRTVRIAFTEAQLRTMLKWLEGRRTTIVIEGQLQPTGTEARIAASGIAELQRQEPKPGQKRVA